MSQNNITSINPFQSGLTDNAVTLNSVKAAINAWRKTKNTSSEKIPATLWDQILHLLETAPESKILATLGITRPQLKTERRRRQSQAELENEDAAHPETIDFCELRRKSEPVTPLVYKPAESFSTKTSVVEVYRPDGMLMKIHICTDRFEELLRAFFTA